MRGSASKALATGTQGAVPIQADWPAKQPAAARGPVQSRRRRALLSTAATLPFWSAAKAQGSGPAWAQLTPQQREALAPLAGQWATLPADSKRKWLEIAEKYPQLSAEGKARMHARMAEFARLTPEQRATARENFQRAYTLPRENRESAVQQFQALPDDKKKELAERQRREAAKPAPPR